MALASSEGVDLDIELAAAGHSDVVRAQQHTLETLGIQDRLEDVLITLGTQYHLIRLLPDAMFLYLVLDRSRANLALARHRLAAVSRELVV
ncbi:hypothetical protein [Nocardioides sp.]|uniref:hypothetical protein n=1 Tax=Nocardioides sp. TaxID=35761 RepID=UPI00286E5E78|nr:hypothetical protein [Nocardioides sp.]